MNYFLVLGKNSKEILHIVDLPGFGYAEASIELRKGWKKLVEDYIEKSGNLRGFLLLIDSRRGLQDEELQLLEYLALNKRAVGVALTKADKIGKVESAKVIRETVKSLSSLGSNNYYPILHSAKNGVGNELIWRWIFERINDEG